MNIFAFLDRTVYVNRRSEVRRSTIRRAADSLWALDMFKVALILAAGIVIGWIVRG